MRFAQLIRRMRSEIYFVRVAIIIATVSDLIHWYSFLFSSFCLYISKHENFRNIKNDDKERRAYRVVRLKFPDAFFRCVRIVTRIQSCRAFVSLFSLKFSLFCLAIHVFFSASIIFYLHFSQNANKKNSSTLQSCQYISLFLHCVVFQVRIRKCTSYLAFHCSFFAQ